MDENSQWWLPLAKGRQPSHQSQAGQHPPPPDRTRTESQGPVSIVSVCPLRPFLWASKMMVPLPGKSPRSPRLLVFPQDSEVSHTCEGLPFPCGEEVEWGRASRERERSLSPNRNNFNPQDRDSRQADFRFIHHTGTAVLTLLLSKNETVII